MLGFNEVLRKRSKAQRQRTSKEKSIKTLPYDSDAMVMHYCYSLTPRQFNALVGKSKLSFMQWYDALWILQHDPNIGISDLAGKLDTSWPTAQGVKQKIVEILPH